MNEKTALIKTNMELQIPNIKIVPCLDEIQSFINQLMHNTLDTMKLVTVWAQRDMQNLIENDILLEEECMYIYSILFIVIFNNIFL